MNTQPKIVVLGGGTGSIAVLAGLKDKAQVTAIVAMADDGGSNGVLRDELGVLPASDLWKCMTALSDKPSVAELFRYRFSEGTFSGHTLGNMIMAAASKTTGNFEQAVAIAEEILAVHGQVVPATLDDVRLQMSWQGRAPLVGEHIIDVADFDQDPRQATLELTPKAHAAPAAIQAITTADMIVIAPGDIYTSLGQILIIEGIHTALRASTATKIYVANLITKSGHTDGFTVADHAAEIERLAGGEFLDYVLYNTTQPTGRSQIDMVAIDETYLLQQRYHAIGGDFLGAIIAQDSAESLTTATRSAIRHDEKAVAAAIMKLPPDHP